MCSGMGVGSQGPKPRHGISRRPAQRRRPASRPAGPAAPAKPQTPRGTQSGPGCGASGRHNAALGERGRKGGGSGTTSRLLAQRNGAGSCCAATGAALLGSARFPAGNSGQGPARPPASPPHRRQQNTGGLTLRHWYRTVGWNWRRSFFARYRASLSARDSPSRYGGTTMPPSSLLRALWSPAARAGSDVGSPPRAASASAAAMAAVLAAAAAADARCVRRTPGVLLWPREASAAASFLAVAAAASAAPAASAPVVTAAAPPTLPPLPSLAAAGGRAARGGERWRSSAGGGGGAEGAGPGRVPEPCGHRSAGGSRAAVAVAGAGGPQLAARPPMPVVMTGTQVWGGAEGGKAGWPGWPCVGPALPPPTGRAAAAAAGSAGGGGGEPPLSVPAVAAATVAATAAFAESSRRCCSGSPAAAAAARAGPPPPLEQEECVGPAGRVRGRPHAQLPRQSSACNAPGSVLAAPTEGVRAVVCAASKQTPRPQALPQPKAACAPSPPPPAGAAACGAAGGRSAGARGVPAGGPAGKSKGDSGAWSPAISPSRHSCAGGATHQQAGRRSVLQGNVRTHSLPSTAQQGRCNTRPPMRGGGRGWAGHPYSFLPVGSRASAAQQHSKTPWAQQGCRLTWVSGIEASANRENMENRPTMSMASREPARPRAARASHRVSSDAAGAPAAGCGSAGGGCSLGRKAKGEGGAGAGPPAGARLAWYCAAASRAATNTASAASRGSPADAS
jgi:hypothetical protein